MAHGLYLPLRGMIRDDNNECRMWCDVDRAKSSLTARAEHQERRLGSAWMRATATQPTELPHIFARLESLNFRMTPVPARTKSRTPDVLQSTLCAWRLYSKKLQPIQRMEPRIPDTPSSTQVTEFSCGSIGAKDDVSYLCQVSVQRCVDASQLE